MAGLIKITDERVEALRVQYGLDPSDFWELPQRKGTWIAKHSALEVIAVKAHILFESPQIIEANTESGIAVLAVRGTVANEPHRTEWATGEASPGNNRNAYPWAMAEKRAKDRVVLKLAGIHGLVYSEDELDTPPPKAAIPVESPRKPVEALPVPAKSGLKNTAQRDVWGRMVTATRACKSIAEFNALWDHPASKAAYDNFPPDWKQEMDFEIADKESELSERLAKIAATP